MWGTVRNDLSITGLFCFLVLTASRAYQPNTPAAPYHFLLEGCVDMFYTNPPAE